ncbi:MAG: methyltransferase domain-containing protein [Bacteroidia bacterium]|nr:methyltransferase domain-containing protein [Bacteroidia bacterium]
MKQEKTKNNFDFIAPVYDSLATWIYGKAIRMVQVDLLQYLRNGDKLLILGGGTGWIISEIFKIVEPELLVYVEPSQVMMEKSKQRINNLSPVQRLKVNLVHDRAENLQLNEEFDAILGFFFFDLFESRMLVKLLNRLQRNLKTRGKLLVADFFLKEKPSWRKPLLDAMYLFFRWVSGLANQSLAPFDEIFSNQGFKLASESFYFQNFIRGTAWYKIK